MRIIGGGSQTYAHDKSRLWPLAIFSFQKPIHFALNAVQPPENGRSSSKEESRLTKPSLNVVKRWIAH